MSEKHSLRQAYRNITAPSELDDAMAGAVTRGKRSMRAYALRRRALMSVAAILAVFAIGINASPAFGNAMESLPGLGRVVNIMRIGNSSIGGKITDGQELGPITVASNTVTVAFSAQGQPSGTAPWFKTTYYTHPYSLVVELHGVRSLFADGVMPSVEDNAFISSIYRLVTLDDSAQRFVVSFVGPVSIEVRELADPAAIQIVLSEDKSEQPAALYSVRTASQGVGELIGIMEETLKLALRTQSENVRVIGDEQGGQFVEAGLFTTEAEALEHVKTLKSTTTLDFGLLVEHRTPGGIPGFVAP